MSFTGLGNTLYNTFVSEVREKRAYRPIYSDLDFGVPSSDLAVANYSTDMLRSGIQLGLIGAAAGLGYGAIRSKVLDTAPPSAGDSIRDTLVGALIGSSLGVAGSHTLDRMDLKARSNPRSFVGLSEYMNRRLGNYPNTIIYQPPPKLVYRGHEGYRGGEVKSGSYMEKEAIVPLLLGAGKLGLMAFSAYSAAQAAKHGVKAIGSAAQGNWSDAGGHALRGTGEAVMALPGAGLARTAKFMQPALKASPGLKRVLGKGMVLDSKIWGPVRRVPAGAQGSMTRKINRPTTGFGSPHSTPLGRWNPTTGANTRYGFLPTAGGMARGMALSSAPVMLADSFSPNTGPLNYQTQRAVATGAGRAALTPGGALMRMSANPPASPWRVIQ